MADENEKVYVGERIPPVRIVIPQIECAMDYEQLQEIVEQAVDRAFAKIWPDKGGKDATDGK